MCCGITVVVVARLRPWLNGSAVGLLLVTILLSSSATKATEFLCLNEEGPLQVVSGLFNAEKFEPPVEPNKKFDARMASFEYPETFSHAMVSLGNGDADSPNMCWAGGFFTAALSWHDLDISWETSKQGYDDVDRGKNKRGEMNNTTSATSYHDNMTWTDLHVYNMHDGIRTNNTYNNWTIQHVWFDYIRDDCIENDHIYSGTVYDSLFDGCYAGISVRPSSTGTGLGQTITMDKVLMRMEPMPYPYKWDTDDDPVVYVDGYGDVPFGHGNVFKLDAGNEPEFRITNSVFLHEYDAQKVIFPPADKITACNNNTIIWLADPATAPTYLLDDFPGCFTLIIDEAEGKAFWKNEVADWHTRHPDVGANRKPAVPGDYSWPRYAATGAPAPTVSLAADPTSISSGESATLAWNATNATSCSSTNFSTGGAVSGSVSVSPTVTTTYSVTCAGEGGTSSDSATVTVGGVGGDTEMRVASTISIGSQNNAKRWTATALIWIETTSGVSVSDATVNGTWGLGAKGNGNCTTDASGSCDVSKSLVCGADATFTVTAVTHASLNFVPGANDIIQINTPCP